MTDSNALQGKPFVTSARKRVIFKLCAEINSTKLISLFPQSPSLEWLLIPLAAQHGMFLSVNATEVELKLDTEADIIVIPEEMLSW